MWPIVYSFLIKIPVPVQEEDNVLVVVPSKFPAVLNSDSGTELHPHTHLRLIFKSNQMLCRMTDWRGKLVH